MGNFSMKMFKNKELFINPIDKWLFAIDHYIEKK